MKFADFLNSAKRKQGINESLRTDSVEIKDKIDNNLEKLKKAEKEFELEAEKLSQGDFQQENDFAKFIDIVKHFNILN